MTLKKLDTFVIKDAFSLSELELFEQAQKSAFRRAELMGWTDVTVVRTEDPAYKENEFICHTYDLIGRGAASNADSESHQKPKQTTSPSGLAAKELNP